MYRNTKRQFCETMRGNRVAPGGGYGGREEEREKERGVNGKEHEQEHV